MITQQQFENDTRLVQAYLKNYIETYWEAWSLNIKQVDWLLTAYHLIHLD